VQDRSGGAAAGSSSRCGRLETKGAIGRELRPLGPAYTNTGRYHLTLVADGRPMLHGWWANEAVACARFSAWVGRHGDRPGAHITLTDEETNSALTQWPDLPLVVCHAARMSVRPFPSRDRARRQIMRRHSNQIPAHLLPMPPAAQGTVGDYRLSTRAGSHP